MTNQSSSLWNRMQQLYITLADAQWDVSYMAFLLVMEMVLCRAIITFVSYTEIDWIAYIQEVTTWQEGELDYIKIRGDTGPLVYPAGFLYLYATLKHLTHDGKDIHRAQVVFGYLYILTTALVLQLYKTCARRMLALNTTTTTTTTSKQQGDESLKSANIIWSWRVAMGLCCLSKRIHSIFVLRLFNDAPSMMLLYMSTVLFTRQKWRLGCFFFSVAISIKMNILLFAPGLLLLLLQANSLKETVLNLTVCAAVQVILGAPFLMTHPISYLRKAFELDRVFMYKWTVNWKFLPQDQFVSKQLSLLLLVLHLSCLAVLCFKWIQSATNQQQREKKQNTTNNNISTRQFLLTPEYIVYTLMVSNFVGICFARTLHYQFYVWYFHSLPILLWISSMYPMWLCIILVACVEYAFNVYPATSSSSAILQVAHLAILASVAIAPVPQIKMEKETKAAKEE